MASVGGRLNISSRGALIGSLQGYTENFSLFWDDDGSRYLRLLRARIDGLSIIETFLAVQSQINSVLQAEGSREFRLHCDRVSQ